MVLCIDGLMVGSTVAPLATLDVAGNLRTSQDAMINRWAIGSLGTANACIMFGGLAANCAALSQTPGGQTMLNAAAGQTVIFADGGVAGLQYSRSSLLGNLTVATGVGSGTADQVFTVRNSGLAANAAAQALVLMAAANGRLWLDTRGGPLFLAANGSAGLQVAANGALSASVATFSNLAVANLQLGTSLLAPGATSLQVQTPCLAVNQPTPASGYSADVLGNVRVAGGTLRIDGTGSAAPGLSLGYPGSFLIDSSGVTGGRLSVDNQGRANVGGPLNVAGPVTLAQQLNMASGQVISLNGDLNHTLQYDSTTDGPRLQGFAGGVLGTSQATANAFVWTPSNASTFLPLNVVAPLTVLSNSSVVSTDPFIVLSRRAGQPEGELAVASAVNLHSNVAAAGDLVLRTRNNGNLVFHSSNTGPGLYVNSNNAVGVQTVSINPAAVLDVAGAVHFGLDNSGSSLRNVAGRNLYTTLPTWRQLATFYASNNAGNGAQLLVTGPCGAWQGSKGEVRLTVSSSGGLTATAGWLGALASGVDLQVWTVGNVASVWLQVSATYASYNLDISYGGQGYTSFLQPETTTAPSGTLAFSAAAQPSLVVGAANVAANSLNAAQANVTALYAANATVAAISTPGTVSVTASNPGDLISKAYGGLGDRYGLGQYNNGATRVFTSSTYSPATVNLSLASTDGPSGASTLWSDLLTASQYSIVLNRPAFATANLVVQNGNQLCLANTNTVNFGYDVAGKEVNAGRVGYGVFSLGGALDIVGAGTSVGTRKVQIYDNLTVGNGTVFAGTAQLTGNVNAAGVNVSGNLAVYGSQGVTVQSGSALPLQLISTAGGAGNPIGLGFQTYTGRGSNECVISAIDDGAFSAHLTVATANTGSAANLPVERMRVTSAGLVGINQTVPQFLVHAQPLATDVPAINPDATNSVMVYEDCRGSTVSAGTLTGNSSYSQSNGYIQLTPNSPGTDGTINYNINPGTAFDVTAETYVGTSGSTWADAIAFYCYSSTATPGTSGGAGTGYSVVIDEYAQNSAANPSYPYTIALYYNNTVLASQTPSTFTFALNTWNQLRISFVRNVWKVWLAGTLVISYQDTSRVLVGPGTYNMGFAGHCGGLSATHLVRNIQISKHCQGPWRPTTAGNVVGISYNGPVVINGNLAVYAAPATGVQLYGTSGTYYTATGGSGNCGLQLQSYAGRGGGPTTAIVNQDDNAYSGHLCFHTAPAGSPGNTLTERMRITSAGYVSVGNTAPQYPFDVQGTAHFSSQVIQSYPTMTRYYQYASSSSTSGASSIPWTCGIFSNVCAGNFNPTSTAMLATNTTTNPGSANAQCPLITVPYAGVWAFVLTVRFNSTPPAGGENSIWFAPYVSPTWGETNANGYAQRCGYTSTLSIQLTTHFTGYFGTGDTIAMCAYSSVANQLVSFGIGNSITMTCIARSQ